MKKFDVTNILISDDGRLIVAYNERYKSIMLIEPETTPEGEITVRIKEPDGIERDYWRHEFGLISEEEFLEVAKKLKVKEEKEKLYKQLKKEFEAGRP